MKRIHNLSYNNSIRKSCIFQRFFYLPQFQMHFPTVCFHSIRASVCVHVSFSPLLNFYWRFCVCLCCALLVPTVAVCRTFIFHSISFDLILLADLLSSNKYPDSLRNTTHRKFVYLNT